MVELLGMEVGERELRGDSDSSVWARGGLAGRERAMGEQQDPVCARLVEGAHTEGKDKGPEARPTLPS